MIARFIIGFLVFSSCSILGQTPPSETEAYLSWTPAKIEAIGKQMRQKGKVGSAFTMRGLNTQRAINYKIRATLMSPEMIRATARLEQLRNRLTDDQTRALVREALDAADLVVMVEINPIEGSGVIPLDWRVFLQPKGLRVGEEGVLAGEKSPQFRKVKALGGVFKRKYEYDLFFVSFPLVNEKGESLIAEDVAELELVVGIYGREGRVDWRVPASVRERIESLSGELTEGTK